MWVTSSTLSVLVTLIVTRSTKAGYNNEQGRSQYKESTASFKCTEEGYHPDPRDCRIYYRCVDWGNGGPLTTFRFTCGVATVFSKDKGDICTHPEDSGRAECAGSDNELDSDLRDPSESPAAAQTTVTAATRPQAITTQAPPTTRPFTGASRATTTSRRPETTTRLSSTTNPPSTEQSDNNISCRNGPECTQEGFLADGCDCRRFYRCVDEGHGKFRKYNFTCGVGTVWDPEIQACNHAWAVVRKDCRRDSDGAGGGGDDSASWNGDGGEQSNGDPGGSSSPGQIGDSNSQQPDPPGYPGMPGTTSSSDSSSYPGMPGSPEAQEVPGSSGYPGLPASPAPAYPTTLDSSGVSSSTGSPTTAAYPETSGYPASSGYPDNASGASGVQPDSPDSSNDKPWTGICMEDGFFADPKDCHKFYRCVGEGASFTRYEFRCGIGTAWDSSIQSCNHDYAVAGCNRPSNVVVSEPDASQSETDGANTSDANNPTSPQASVNCTVASTSSKPDAQSPTHVTSATGSPATPDRSTSISYLPPASSTYPPSTVRSTESVSYLPPATQTTASTSYSPPSSTDSTDVQPESTAGSVSHSPGGGTPATATIATSTLPSSSSSTVSPSQDGKSECTEAGFFPDPNDCRKFYRCVEGQSGYRKYEFQCGPGTAWDQSIQTCNHIGQVPCSTDSNEIDQGSDTSKPASPPPVTTETTSSAAPPPPTESVTVAGTPSEATTSELSTSEADKTEASAATTADTAIITVSGGDEPASGRPEQVQTLGTSSTEASSESSSEQSTSESSEASSSSTESSEASSSSSTESSSESHGPACTTRKPSGAITCDNEGFHPHPTRCDKFYRCVDNGNGFNVYHFDCPPGTIFDPSISVCNYPESVYPARDCTTGDAGSSSSSDVPTTESTTAEQTEEITSASTEAAAATTSSTETTTSEVSKQTSEVPEGGESTTESATESTVAATEAATDSSVSDQTAEATSADLSTESMEPGATTTESQESSATESQEQSTSESQEQSTTESSKPTTVEPATPCSVGNLTDDQIILVCPTGFRRHPKHCNLFYQCTSEGNMEIKILVLSCPEDTIFDESKTQCLPEDSSGQPCTGTKANARFYRRLEDNASASVKVSTNRLCPEEGHFPYRQDCSDIFYKCKRDVRDSLQGYLYKCPEDFVYWSVSRRCERAARLPMCSRSAHRNNTSRYDRWRIPTERLNLSARMLRLS